MERVCEYGKRVSRERGGNAEERRREESRKWEKVIMEGKGGSGEREVGGKEEGVVGEGKQTQWREGQEEKKQSYRRKGKE